MKLYRDVYQVKAVCGVQLRLISASEHGPLIVFLCLFCEIYIFVHPHNSLTVYDIFMQVYRNVY